MYSDLTTQRIRSIDAFRGITILVMIFVNDVAYVSGVPGWMMHKPADADAMTFVDVVFPAFLFIVGMSLPFAIASRLAKGERFWKIQGHILSRTIGLLILGIFMETEQEDDYNEKAMGISLAAWSLLFYLCVILVWNVYRFKNKIWSYAWRAMGAIGLILLAFDYRGGVNGSHGLIPHSWGVLGLIGWAYLLSCIIYQLAKGRIFLLMTAIASCIAWYAISRSGMANNSIVLKWMAGKPGHAVHTSIVLFGVVLSLLFFDKKSKINIKSRFVFAGLLSLAAFATGYCLRPYYAISKIYATPTWGLYSVGACMLLYSFLYWLTDIKKFEKWTGFFQPAASNSLLVYILPGIIMFLQIEFDLYFMPATFHEGLLGIAWSACFAVLVMWLALGLNKLKIRLHL